MTVSQSADNRRYAVKKRMVRANFWRQRSNRRWFGTLLGISEQANGSELLQIFRIIGIYSLAHEIAD